MQVLYQMNCVRKHILKSKTYYLQVLEDSMILSEHKNMVNPKYIIQFNLETRVMWKVSEQDELSSFGIYYVNRIKWFDSDHNQLNLLKIHLSPKVFLEISPFFMILVPQSDLEHLQKFVWLKQRRVFLNLQPNAFLKSISCKKSHLIAWYQFSYSLLEQIIKIDHPHFVKLHEIYQGENSYYLVTDYLAGDTLYNYIKTFPDDQIPPHQIREAIKIILTALKYLEINNIIHRDIKLENILLQKQNDITSLKIIDFGLAIYALPEQKVSICGTPGYIAPEILKNSNVDDYFTPKCDIFSAGVIFYKLLTKKTLFRAQNTMEIMEQNKLCQVNYQDIQYKLQKEAVSLLKSMLDPNPKTRFSAAQCLEHPYFSCKLENINILQEILDKATGFSGLSQIKEYKDTHSIGQECQAAQIKKCNPTSYRVRAEQRKRTKSPRKYAEFQFYCPSFCQMNSFESLSSKGSSSYSNKVSRIENLINDRLDSVIEDDEKFQKNVKQVFQT
ncbi:unnamed protein product (macronuclear) [Paramecium tetraurelia]|uniref:Protein kinase domain-containing protein n=1 Tax=Paramecium tetraurelia TaxID=5888 RepID=A0E2H1_PARTE|nr:uncharacterized protein GSPATT00022660001 [Paramecium tetraurelia]CAK89488.1 unnamed protein product [Paramecium tetraurelia]|eukprot:XP_001456885.1 hypothetical protein (macronuclear) [Paramecium tetraurelia strain d4-2]